MGDYVGDITPHAKIQNNRPIGGVPGTWVKYHRRMVFNYGRHMEQGRSLYFRPVVCCFFLSFFFPRLFSAVRDWMPTILPHMMWPWCEFRMQV